MFERELFRPGSTVPWLPAPAFGSLRQLDVEDVGKILQLRHRVLANLSHPDCYRVEEDETEFVLQHLEGGGESYGIFDGGELVAYGALGLPRQGEENLGELIGVPSKMLHRVSHLAASMILPEYQGKHGQRSLILLRLARARALGKGWVVAMVSPHNSASIRNLFSCGLSVRRKAMLYGNVTRLIMARDLGETC